MMRARMPMPLTRIDAPSRRRFIEMGGSVAAALGLPPSLHQAPPEPRSNPKTVHLTGDGLSLEPVEVVAELERLCTTASLATDNYGLGGIVEEVEAYFARLLGKERALFMPTGTLANHLAIRALAGERRRVLVQEVSHIYNDTGDSSQLLSGLTLMPLAPDRATFTWDDVTHVLDRTASGRVAAPVGAISIESPVRRRSGELFDPVELARITKEARQRGIGLHLDGARLFIASAYTGTSPADYAAPFDTVYVSLWKYFNSINGAILAGPASKLEGMLHVRRMFGGALWNAWPFALLARRYAEGFVERLKSAIAISEEFLRAARSAGCEVVRVANGTNVFRLVVPTGRGEHIRARLQAADILVPAPTRQANGDVFGLQVNETWNRTTATRLADHLRQALNV